MPEKFVSTVEHSKRLKSMATIIQVKRTTTANLPSTLEQGELAYIYDTSATDTDAGSGPRSDFSKIFRINPAEEALINTCHRKRWLMRRIGASAGP